CRCVLSAQTLFAKITPAYSVGYCRSLPVGPGRSTCSSLVKLCENTSVYARESQGRVYLINVRFAGVSAAQMRSILGGMPQWSDEERELAAIVDAIAAYEAVRWPHGRISGGKG